MAVLFLSDDSEIGKLMFLWLLGYVLFSVLSKWFNFYHGMKTSLLLTKSMNVESASNQSYWRMTGSCVIFDDWSGNPM